MTHLKTFIIALFLVISTPGISQAAPEERDWFWLVSALQSHGIDPNRVAWAQVNQSCMWAPSQSDAFVGCQYEKVMDREQHIADYALCDGEAVSAYPRGLATPHSGYYRPVTYSQKEVRLSRAAYTRRCMVELGWKNPDNYLMGRREAGLDAPLPPENKLN